MKAREDIICAPATVVEGSSIALIRVSGAGALATVQKIFNKSLKEADSHRLYFGHIVDGNETVDEVLVAAFHQGQSFTGEEMAEINCHASVYVVEKIMQLLFGAGCRAAQPGEFSLRAFLNGKMDLTQAEAIPELIAAETEQEHRTAMYQMRGGFSKDLKELRTKLLRFASLIELELDFSEEDVEFADRTALKVQIQACLSYISQLLDSFQSGNALKQGIPIVIAGKPNVGKSTLLNTLLNEEKAIVTDMPGTTRDFIEDTVVIRGIKFRFIDTAGIRQAENPVEAIGIERSLEKIEQAHLCLYVFDLLNDTSETLRQALKEIEAEGRKLLLVGNKLDAENDTSAFSDFDNAVYISAKEGINMEGLKDKILEMNGLWEKSGHHFILTNARHHTCLSRAQNALQQVEQRLDDGSTHDLIALDLRRALNAIGEITGEISNENILDVVFREFCIGK